MYVVFEYRGIFGKDGENEMVDELFFSRKEAREWIESHIDDSFEKVNGHTWNNAATQPDTYFHQFILKKM